MSRMLYNQAKTNVMGHRSSLSKVFCKKGVLKSFAKFTGKYLRPSLFFDRVVGLSPVTLLKKRL